MRAVGIYYAFWTHEWDIDFKPYIRKVKDLGFDQLEINGGTVVRLGESEQKQLADMAADEGVVLSYGIGLQKPYDVSSLDETVRRRGIKFMKEMIRSVSRMGGGMIGGTVHSCWPASLPEGTEDKTPMWRKSVESMGELAPFAHDHGVKLNVEVINRFEQFLINDSHEALRYVQEVDHPACGILLDTFHMNIEEDSFSEAIQRVGPYLTALHLGETNRKTPGTGRIPWGEIKDALDAAGFDGPLVMEPFVMKGGQIGRDIAVWRDLIEHPDLDALASQAASFVKAALR